MLQTRPDSDMDKSNPNETICVSLRCECVDAAMLRLIDLIARQTAIELELDLNWGK